MGPSSQCGEGVIVKVLSNFPLFKECPICSRAVYMKSKDLNTENRHITIIRCESCKHNFPSDSCRWKFRIKIQVCLLLCCVLSRLRNERVRPNLHHSRWSIWGQSTLNFRLAAGRCISATRQTQTMRCAAAAKK